MELWETIGEVVIMSKDLKKASLWLKAIFVLMSVFFVLAYSPKGECAATGSEKQILESQMNNLLGDMSYYELDVQEIFRKRIIINTALSSQVEAEAKRLQEALAKSGEDDAAAKKAMDQSINELQRLRKTLDQSGIAVTNSLEIWPITRMMVFGVKGLGSATEMHNQLKANGTELKFLIQAYVNAIMYGLFQSGNAVEMTKTEFDKFLNEYIKTTKDSSVWMEKYGTDGKITVTPDLLKEIFGTTHIEIGSSPSDGTGTINPSTNLRLGLGATQDTALETELVKAKQIEESMKKLEGGMHGLFGTSETIYTRTRTIGIIILMAVFFARVFYMVLANVIGTARFGGIAPWALLGKFVFYIILILAIPNIAHWGMQVSDALQSTLFDIEGADAGKGYNTPQLRTLALARLDDMMNVRIVSVGGMVESEDFVNKIQNAWTLLTSEPKNILYILTIVVVGFLVTATVSTMLLLADIMMGITLCFAPIVLAISLFPSCEKWTEHAMKSWLTYVTMGPMAALYILIVTCLCAMSANLTIVTFLVTSIIAIKMAGMLPQMCESMSSAVMAGAIGAIAAMPGRAAKWAGQNSAWTAGRMAGKGGIKGGFNAGKWAAGKMMGK